MPVVMARETSITSANRVTMQRENRATIAELCDARKTKTSLTGNNIIVTACTGCSTNPVSVMRVKEQVNREFPLSISPFRAVQTGR